MKVSVESKEISLYYGCLFVLSLLQVISDISYLGNSWLYNFVSKLIIFITYAGLVLIILNKRYKLSSLIVFFVILLILLYGYIQNGMTAFVSAWLLIFAIKDYNYRTALKCIYIAFIIGMSLAFISYLPSLLNSDVFNKELYDGFTLGLGQKNQAGIYLVFLYLLRKAIYKKNKDKYIKSFIYATIVYGVTKSKTAALVIVLYSILLGVLPVVYNKIPKITEKIVQIFMPFLFGFSYVTAVLFPTNKFVQMLDIFMTNRIFLNWFILSKNTVKLWGQNIMLNYYGVYNQVRNTGNISTTVDNAYMVMLLVMGIIPSILYCIGYMYVIKKGLKNMDFQVVSIAIIIALYGFSEVKIINILFSFVLLYINSVDSFNQKKVEKVW